MQHMLFFNGLRRNTEKQRLNGIPGIGMALQHWGIGFRRPADAGLSGPAPLLKGTSGQAAKAAPPDEVRGAGRAWTVSFRSSGGGGGR
jgi:hypothetical protein